MCGHCINQGQVLCGQPWNNRQCCLVRIPTRWKQNWTHCSCLSATAKSTAASYTISLSFVVHFLYKIALSSGTMRHQLWIIWKCEQRWINKIRHCQSSAKLYIIDHSINSAFYSYEWAWPRKEQFISYVSLTNSGDYKSL